MNKKESTCSFIPKYFIVAPTDILLKGPSSIETEQIVNL